MSEKLRERNLGMNWKREGQIGNGDQATPGWEDPEKGKQRRVGVSSEMRERELGRLVRDFGSFHKYIYIFMAKKWQTS